MATARTRTDRRANDEALSRRDALLAELVVGLSDCDEDVARDAVRDHGDAADPLAVVARALTDIRADQPEPQDRLRVAGFLRPDPGRLPRRPRRGPSGAPGRATPASATAVADRAEDHLVHHGSLRRWERSDHGESWAPADEVGDPETDAEAQVIDLRDRTARFRRPGPGPARTD